MRMNFFTTVKISQLTDR